MISEFLLVQHIIAMMNELESHLNNPNSPSSAGMSEIVAVQKQHERYLEQIPSELKKVETTISALEKKVELIIRAKEDQKKTLKGYNDYISNAVAQTKHE
jgi:hypothetical protein